MQLYLSLALQAHIPADFKTFREDCSNSLDCCIFQLISFTKFDAHFNIKLQEWRCPGDGKGLFRGCVFLCSRSGYRLNKLFLQAGTVDIRSLLWLTYKGKKVELII